MANFEIKIDGIKLLLLFFIFILAIVYYYIEKKRLFRRSVLLTGLSGSGKTLLFTQLIHKKFVKTETSVEDNHGVYRFKDKTLQIIDIPGQKDLRYNYLDLFKSRALGIVFVVDSVTIQQNIKYAAEFLYNILVDPIIEKYSPKILILCNKQDRRILAKGRHLIKFMFEKEINALHISKCNQLEDSPNIKIKSKLNMKHGDSDDQYFSFLESKYKIVFAESYVYNNNKGDVGMENLWNWLKDLM